MLHSVHAVTDDVPDYNGPGPDEEDGDIDEGVTDEEPEDPSAGVVPGGTAGAAGAAGSRSAPRQGGSSMPKGHQLAPAVSGKKR